MSPTETPAAPALPQSFKEMSEAVQGHYRAFPGHRAGCTCLYPLAREIAGQLRPGGVWTGWENGNERAAMADLLVEIARRL